MLRRRLLKGSRLGLRPLFDVCVRKRVMGKSDGRRGTMVSGGRAVGAKESIQADSLCPILKCDIEVEAVAPVLELGVA